MRMLCFEVALKKLRSYPNSADFAGDQLLVHRSMILEMFLFLKLRTTVTFKKFSFVMCFQEMSAKKRINYGFTYYEQKGIHKIKNISKILTF